MNDLTKQLQPHPLYREKTFQSYCDKIQKFHFRDGVPEDVIKNFEVIEKLLIHGYFEPKFIDVAYVKSLHTLEMAMSFKYKEFFPNNRVPGFKKLIELLSKKHVFDSSRAALLNEETLRNIYSHPKWHSFAGTFNLHAPEYINRLINEMYDDIPLRLERERLSKEFNIQQEQSNLKEFLFYESGNEKIIFYSAVLQFINNKYSPHVYTLVCCPLFNFEGEEGESIERPVISAIQFINPLFKNNILTAINWTTKQNVIMYHVRSNEEFKDYFEKWYKQWDGRQNQFHYKLTIRNNPEIIIPLFQEFQKM